MARNPQSMTDDELITTDPADAAARSEMLQVQLKSSARLNEYYNQVVAELRASLDEIEQRDRAS